MCPRGLKYAYLLNSLPSCLLRIPWSPAWWQIAKILGSTSIRHRSHASASAFAMWGAVLTRPEWCSPAPGYLHVRCLKWWRPHEVIFFWPLQWRHNGCYGISKHRRLDCLLNHLFRRRSKKTSKHHVTGLCEGNSPGMGEFPSRRASNAENVSIWWRHRAIDTDWWCVIARFVTKEIIWSQIARSYSLSWKKNVVFCFISYWIVFLHVQSMVNQYQFIHR